jgi:hypothetical protein
MPAEFCGGISASRIGKNETILRMPSAMWDYDRDCMS